MVCTWALEVPGQEARLAHLCILTPAAVLHSIPIVPRLALGTVWPCRVVEAAQALPRAPVTRLWICHVDVIVALAGQAAPAGLQRVSVVPRCTLITAGTCWHKVLSSAWGQGCGHQASHSKHSPVYPGLQWQTTCRERPSW